jgi:hypothetical protein
MSFPSIGMIAAWLSTDLIEEMLGHYAYQTFEIPLGEPA